MRTVAWEAAFQIPLKNCSKEVRGKVSIYVILVKVNVCALKHTNCLLRSLLLVS